MVAGETGNPAGTERPSDDLRSASVLLDDPILSRALRTQFESLIDRGHVRRLTRGLE